MEDTSYGWRVAGGGSLKLKGKLETGGLAGGTQLRVPGLGYRFRCGYGYGCGNQARDLYPNLNS
jgi:hypothetical protein